MTTLPPQARPVTGSIQVVRTHRTKRCSEHAGNRETIAAGRTSHPPATTTITVTTTTTTSPSMIMMMIMILMMMRMIVMMGLF